MRGVEEAGAAPSAALAEDFVAVLIIAIANRLTRGASRYYREVWSIGVVEWRILVCLGYRDRQSLGDLAEAADLDRGAASRSVKSLGERGLIRAEPGAGRLNHVSLTTAGRQMLAKLRSAGRQREDRLMSAFSKDERPQVIGYLKRLLSQVDYMNARAD